MAWLRTIPFGYQMRQGKIMREQIESDAVKNIFSMYLAGESLNRIAERMSESGIRYHQHTEQWNKNMVKRVLENTRYLGDEDYPKIIDNNDFLAVRLQKADRNTYAPCKQEIGTIAEKAVCSACGAVMRRDTKANGRARWKCQNTGCGKIVPFTDGAMEAAVNGCLSQLERAPYLLEMQNPSQQKISMDALRLLNELTAAFNRGTESGEYMRSLIFAGAAEKYNLLPDLTPQYKMDRLRTRLVTGETSNELRRALMDFAVRAIRIGGTGEIELELINGKIINGSEENTNECADVSSTEEGHGYPGRPEI